LIAGSGINHRAAIYSSALHATAKKVKAKKVKAKGLMMETAYALSCLVT
jgi:hypothetical protein